MVALKAGRRHRAGLAVAGRPGICQAKGVRGSWYWVDLVLSRWLPGRAEGPQQKRLEVNRGLPETEEGPVSQPRPGREVLYLYQGDL